MSIFNRVVEWVKRYMDTYARQYCKEQWIEIFKQTIDHANTRYDAEFVDSMIDAINTSTSTTQSEFWLRMLSVMDRIAKQDSCYFDSRNAWVKETMDRIIWANSHQSEIDAVRRMEDSQLRRLRLS